MHTLKYRPILDIPVFYSEIISDQHIITLEEETSKHIVQVLRMKPGEMLQLTDGKGNLATASIIDDHKKKCTVKIIEHQFREKSKRNICIAISLLKNANRFEWFLEKATEIGVTEIKPILCSRTEKQNFRYDRMQQILVSAMMQSKQVWLPVLHQPQKFEEVIVNSAYNLKLIAHCTNDHNKKVNDFIQQNNVEIYIGPEGDFTPYEIEQANQLSFQSVSLGKTRLRTETAGVVAATILSL